MRARQLVRVQYMSTFHGTNGMSIKRWYTDAGSLVGLKKLSGDAALLFWPHSGCTGNILSFYPAASPRSISNPLSIDDFLCSPSLSLQAFPPLHEPLLESDPLHVKVLTQLSSISAFSSHPTTSLSMLSLSLHCSSFHFSPSTPCTAPPSFSGYSLPSFLSLYLPRAGK